MSYFDKQFDKQEKDEIKLLIRRFLRGDLEDKDLQILRAKLTQGASASLMPDYFTDVIPEQGVVERARAIQAFDKHGYQVGTDNINPNFNDVLYAQLNYKNNQNSSLSDSFGELQPRSSNSDYFVMQKKGELPTVFFRGSKMNYNDPNMINDWIHNARTLPIGPNQGYTKIGGSKEMNRIEGNFDELYRQFGGIKEVVGYSKGGALAGYFAQKYNLKANVFNPHINNLFNFKSTQGDITIHRTINDPATAVGSLQGADLTNFKVKTYPPLSGSTGMAKEHKLVHFTDDHTPRELFNRFALEGEAANRLRTIEGNMRNMSPQAKTNLRERISLLDKKTLNNYILPRNRAMRSSLMSHTGRAISVRTGASAVSGIGIGIALDSLSQALNIDEKLNPELYSLLLGAVSAGLTEAAVMKLTQGSVLGKGLISKLSNFSRLGANVLGGGIGLVVGVAATKGIFNLFDPGADPYLKHITSNILGAELGTIAGLAVVGGIGAAATSLGLVSATNWWNPIGWGAAIALAITGVAGGIAGAVSAGQEVRTNELVNYSGQAVLLKNQFVYMRELFKELGLPPSQMTTINNELLSRLNDEDAQSLTTEEFTQMFNRYMTTYNQSFNRSGVPIDTDLQGLYYQYNKSLADMADILQSKNIIGPDGNRLENARPIITPPRYLMTPSQYVEEYNKILRQSHSEINEYFGIEELSTPNALPTIDDTPDTFSETETEDVLQYQRDIEIALADEDPEAEFGGEEDES